MFTKIAISIGTMTTRGISRERKLNMTTRKTPSRESRFTRALSAVIVVLIS